MRYLKCTQLFIYAEKLKRLFDFDFYDKSNEVLISVGAALALQTKSAEVKMLASRYVRRNEAKKSKLKMQFLLATRGKNQSDVANFVVLEK